jgi:hypothetical protein
MLRRLLALVVCVQQPGLINAPALRNGLSGHRCGTAHGLTRPRREVDPTPLLSSQSRHKHGSARVCRTTQASQPTLAGMTHLRSLRPALHNPEVTSSCLWSCRYNHRAGHIAVWPRRARGGGAANVPLRREQHGLIMFESQPDIGGVIISPATCRQVGRSPPALLVSPTQQDQRHDQHDQKQKTKPSPARLLVDDDVHPQNRSQRVDR